MIRLRGHSVTSSCDCGTVTTVLPGRTRSDRLADLLICVAVLAASMFALERTGPGLPRSPMVQCIMLGAAMVVALAVWSIRRVRPTATARPSRSARAVVLRISSGGAIELLAPDGGSRLCRLGPGTRVLGPSLVLDLIDEPPIRGVRRRRLLWLSHADLPCGILRRMVITLTTSLSGGRP